MKKIHKRFKGKILCYKLRYKGGKVKGIFVCREHGDFKATPDSLSSAKHGCPICAIINKGHRKRRSFLQYVKKAREVHGYTYTYLRKEENRITYLCRRHGPMFQRHADHLVGKGCKYCARVASSNARRLTLGSIKGRLQSLPDRGYVYLKLDHFKLGTNPTLHYKCPEHGLVIQDVQIHLVGKICPDCARGFLNKPLPRPTSIYVVYFYKVGVWKLGVTCHNVKRRFSGESTPYTLKYLHTFLSGLEAYTLETLIATKLKDHKYRGPKLLISGNTELYTEDITEATKRIIGEWFLET